MDIMSPEVKDNNLQVGWNKLTYESQKLWSEFSTFLKQNKEILFASLIALISLFYFLVTAYSTLFEEVFPGFRIRLFSLAVALIVAVVSFLAFYLDHNPIFKKISLLAQSWLLLLFSYSYFLSIENRNFYPIILAFLPAFIFLIHIILFTNKWLNIYTSLAQIILFVLQTFSLLTFFSVDRVAARSFSQDSLSTVLNLPEWFWLVICALGVSVVSVNYFKLKTAKLNLYFFSLIFWLTIQILYITQVVLFKNFFYWEKTLIFVIMWDFLLVPLGIIANNLKDDKYQPRLVVSTIYHLLLLFIVFIFALI
jgi:hypothetical protein